MPCPAFGVVIVTDVVLGAAPAATTVASATTAASGRSSALHVLIGFVSFRARSARDGAAVLTGVEGVVAPGRLHRELVAGERDVLRLDLRALGAVLARLVVVPTV